MGNLNIDDLKLRWKGNWRSRQQYSKNDVVQWKGISYKCIKDTPVDFIIKSTPNMNTSNYVTNPPQLVRRSYRPDNSRYWSIFIRSTKNVKTWNWSMQYFPGEMCFHSGSVYLCTQQTRYKNTYVTETSYWTKIYTSPDTSKKRHETIMFTNRAPLGWKYNMGENCYGNNDCGYNSQVICSDGTVLGFGGNDNNGRHGYGNDGLGSSDGRGKHAYTGFTFVDWCSSSDQSSWQTQVNTNKLVTPDGKPPKIIQVVSANNTALWLFNNGEVYSSGYNGQGQLGNGNTTDRYYTQRVTSGSTTDWFGNTIPNSFNDTKIVKVGLSNAQQSNSTSSCYALGEDGSVWVWGYNSEGQLGLGNPSTGTDTNNSGFYSGNKTNPIRLPQEYFNGKAIVDMWISGVGQAKYWALDEEGRLWAWGKNNYGELGLGHRDGTYYITKPTPCTIDFRRFGGVKKFVVVHNDDGITTSYVLDHEGWLWAAGYTTSGNVPGAGPVGTGTTLHWGTYRRLDFYMNGDIEEFWAGGDESQWCVLRQKNSDMVWMFNGNFQDGSGGSGVQSNNYWYNSGNQQNVFTYVDGPKGAKIVSGHSMSRVDGSEQYSDPIIFDDNGILWAGGRNYYGYTSQTLDGQLSNEWADGGVYHPDQDLNDNELNFEKKRKVWVPAGTSIVDLHAFGYGSAPMFAWRDENGKLLMSGYDGGSQSCYHYTYYCYYASTSHPRYTMHSAPTD